MADRINAMVFGNLFRTLAAQELPRSYATEAQRLGPELEADKRRIGEALMEVAANYDFAPYQMEADEALIELRLARPWNEGYGDTLVYFGEEEFDRPSPYPRGTNFQRARPGGPSFEVRSGRRAAAARSTGRRR